MYHKLYFIIWLSLFTLKGQNYAPITELQTDWNSIQLNNEILGAIGNEWQKLRVLQVKEQDTLELPFRRKPEVKEHLPNWEILNAYNKSYKSGATYISFRGTDEAVQLLKIDIPLEEYDFSVKVQGCDDGKEWFNIKEQRILKAIFPSQQYLYNQIKISKSDFTFYRLVFPEEIPTDIKVYAQEIIKDSPPTLENVLVQNYNIDHREQTTYIDFNLGIQLPIDRIQLELSYGRPFLRSYKLEYLKDSIKKADGSYYYNYVEVDHGVLNSLDSGKITFPSLWLHKGRLLIENNDNQPLNIGKISCYRRPEIIDFHANQTTPCLLVISSEYKHYPEYDISLLNLSKEEFNLVKMGDIKPMNTTFKDEVKRDKTYHYILYLILGLISFLLLMFALKMMKLMKSDAPK